MHPYPWPIQPRQTGDRPRRQPAHRRGSPPHTRPGRGRRTLARAAFTLMELLVVIGIMALIATLVAPSLKRLKSADLIGAANRQVLDDLAQARRLALANRTTVYVLFMPPADPNLNVSGQLSPEELTTVLANQQIAYAFFAWRTAGDQPGREYPRYLRGWRALPEGIFIASSKFNPRAAVSDPATVDNILYTTGIPFPAIDGVTNVPLPYIAFDHQGRLLSDRQDEILPLARGYVDPVLDAGRNLVWQPARIEEEPPDNSIENYNHIQIDWLTGRPSLERPEIR